MVCKTNCLNSLIFFLCESNKATQVRELAHCRAHCHPLLLQTRQQSKDKWVLKKIVFQYLGLFGK
jgi:hypothetical protein